MLAREKCITIVKNSFKICVFIDVNKRLYLANKLEYRHVAKIF